MGFVFHPHFAPLVAVLGSAVLLAGLAAHEDGDAQALTTIGIIGLLAAGVLMVNHV